MRDNKKAPENTHLYGLIGHPVAHSLSPFIMNRAFRQEEIDAVYLRFDVAGDKLAEAVEGLTALGARGVNVAGPFKEDILPLLGIISPDAELIGAVDTLVSHDGQIIGHHTGAEGVAAALRGLARVSIANARVFLFGAGAGARAAAVGLLRGGAASITFGVRSNRVTLPVVTRLSEAFPDRQIGLAPLHDAARQDELRGEFERADIVINATPVGMGGGPQPRLITDPTWIRSGQCFFDFVYHPGHTGFLETALSHDARVLGGASLLVCKAVESFRQWTGRTFDAQEMLEALGAAFPERSLS
jgi:shikimate dehydrogenase